MLQALLDFVNISAFIPLIGLVAEPNFIFHFKLLPFQLNGLSKHELILIFTLVILIFSIIKFIAIHFITRKRASFAYQIAHHLSSIILTRQLSLDYGLSTKFDFGNEVNRTANIPLTFANNIIVAMATLFSELLIGLLIVSVLAIFNFQLLISLLLLLTPLLLIYTFNRRRIKQLNKEMKEKYPLSFKYSLQVLQGWLEIRTAQKEKYFLSQFKKVNNDLTHVFASEHTLQISSTRLTELFASVVICAIVFWTVAFQREVENTVVVLSVYAVAGFRLLPSINRILNSFIQIKSHEYLFDELKDIGCEAKHENKISVQSSLRNNIFLDSISFSFPQRSVLIENLSLKITRGDKIVITGKSGGGKTSLLLIILGMLRPISGKIYLDNQVVDDKILNSYQMLFSYVPQDPYILDESINENIAFGIDKSKIESTRLNEVLRQVDLLDFVNQLPLKGDTLVGERGVSLSGGQRQRIALARALYADREILILDEVTNQLDKETETEILNTMIKIASQNKTIILVTHQEQLQLKFNKILKLEDGKLMEIKKN